MNHYINLLEPGERRYFSAAETSPLLKIGVVALIVLVVGGVSFAMQRMGTTIREGEALAERWRQISGQVRDAERRTEQLTRLEQDYETLRGWSVSRIAWDEVLEFVQAQLPEPVEEAQFRSFTFDEEMHGLRRHRPDVDNRVHPLQRRVRVQLTGLMAGPRPEVMLGEFEQRLMQAEGTPFEWVRLDLNSPQLGMSTPERRVSQFQYTLNLRTREVRP